MTQFTRAKTTDGEDIAFEAQHFSQGGMKDVHWAVGRTHVAAFYRQKPDPAGMDRLRAIVGPHRKAIIDGEGGTVLSGLYRWPEKIIEWDGRIGILVPAFDKKFFFEHGSFDGDRLKIKGKEKEGKWFASAHNRTSFLDAREAGDWMSYLKICIRLARAVRRLHASGLAHSDLSYKNVLVDPITGEACIIDIDGLVVPHKYPPEVVGTPDFVAPEVVATQHLAIDDPNRMLPSIQTDLHALAVLIYMYLTLRHPLKGRKIHDQSDTTNDDRLSMGERAIFVEHPEDASNRIHLDHVRDSELPWADTDRLPYTLCGPHIAALFERAFIEGLHAPEKRPSAADWERALVQTADMLLPCKNTVCGFKWFPFDNKQSPKCPLCETPYAEEVPILNLYSRRTGEDFRSENTRITVYDGIGLYPWHANRFKFPNERLAAQDKRRVAYFQKHQGKWFIVNEGLDTMRDVQADVEIPRRKHMALEDGAQIMLDAGNGGRLIQVQIAGPSADG